MSTGSDDQSGNNEESILFTSDEVSPNYCDPCKYRSVTTEATSYCTECPEYLCGNCELAHRGLRQTRDHRILTGADIPYSSLPPKPTLPILLCDNHKKMFLNTYCISHKEVICGTCKVLYHKNCKTTDVSQQSSKMKSNGEFNETLKRLTDLKLQFVTLKIARNGDINDVQMQTKKCFHDLRQARKEMMEKYDKLEQKLCEEITRTEKDTTKEIESHVSITEDAIAQIDDQIKSMTECQNSQSDDAMFVGMNKAIVTKSQYNDIMVAMQQDICGIKIQFKINNIMKDVMRQLQSLGSIEVKRGGVFQSQTILQGSSVDPVSPRMTQTHSPRHLLDMSLNEMQQAIAKAPPSSRSNQSSLLKSSVTDKKEIGVGTRHVCGCTFMPNGDLVLACGKDGLLLLDKDLKSTSGISDFSVRVAAINHKEVIITQGDVKQIKRVRLYPDMEVVKPMKVDRTCIGVDVHAGQIYVTCHDNPGNGEVQVLNMKGEVKKHLGVDYGIFYRFSGPSYRFTKPNDVKVNKDGSLIFVSDEVTDIVTCLNKEGQMIYLFSDKDLKTVTGLHVDATNNLLVCGHGSSNVLLVRHDGKKDKILLSQKDGIRYPLSVSHRPSDGRLVVGFGIEAGNFTTLIAFSTTPLRQPAFVQNSTYR